jgi:hypothetical protein
MISIRRSCVLVTVLLAAATVGGASLSAQEMTTPTRGIVAAEVAPAAVPASTRAQAVDLGLRQAAPFVQPVLGTFDVVVQERVRPGQNIFLMTAGGAAVVTGLIIGGDTGLVIATSGAVVGLIGLFRYLK